ncbi:MAG: NirD/YgiW/YdeI family stress tolerance protein [Pasteurellaceae bacterium]|nr:NirD/YgiW/YdeI family stress tolerance protein [Pasteurellaceae bacterium]
MKKLLLVSLLAVSSVAYAGFNGNNQAKGGFVGHGQQVGVITTIAQALKARDDEPVQLTGSIIRQIDNDEFIFRDSTGEIKIDVDDKAWQGQNVGFDDKITVYGKVDKETIGKNSVDVYRVQKH